MRNALVVLLALAACTGGSQTGSVSVTVDPASASLVSNSTQAFTASVSGSADATVLWSIDEASGGSVSADGLYTAPDVSAAATFHVRAASRANASASAAAVVTVSPVVSAPVINSFSASPASISAGSSSTLSFSVSGAQTLSIDHGVGTVTGTSVSVSPSATTTYTLTATNVAGSVTKTAQVQVVPPPVIASFVANPASISSGQSSTLTWSVTGATSLSINSGVGTVTGTSKSVSPTSTTTYTLTATNAGSSVTATAQVSVLAAPQIETFTASVSASGVALAWTISQTATLSIDQSVGTVTGNGTTLHPSASTTYRLTATNGVGSDVAAVTVTIDPASPGAVIESFAADASQVPPGGSTNLRWSVANSATVTLDGVAVSVTSEMVTPASTHTYTLAAGSATAQVTVTVQPVAIAPGNPGGSPAVTFTLDSTQSVHPISPYIYGYNDGSTLPTGTTFLRSGGNRLTAYNWETNASNAGSDYLYENDDLFSGSTPGGADFPMLDKGIAALVTLPMEGWVSADESGPCSLTDPQRLRFFPTLPRKGAAFVSPPNTSDRFVYQDEFVSAIAARYPGRQLFFSLDNEPDLWVGTHQEIQRTPITYAGLLQLSVDLTSAIKDVAPTALTFGPVSYGYEGFVSLQNAPDATGGEWFLDYFLRKMKAAGDAQGRRLLDVLDLHWYPEATGNNTRITNDDNSAPVAAARVQAPRSLWDPSYVETSWITGCCTGGGGIDLIDTVRAKIAAQYPGTQLGFSEYNYGGGDDISGAVAQADVLGIFGREGVFSATLWNLISDDRFFFGAFRNFRDYDGSGSAFGDTSFSAASSDNSRASVYASFDAANPARVIVVAINKTLGSMAVNLTLKHSTQFSKAHAWQLTANSTYTAPTVVPTSIADVTVTSNAFQLTLPASSVTTFAFVP